MSPYFTISAWNRSDQSQAASNLGVQYEALSEIIQKDIVILCTNASFFEKLLLEQGALFNPNAIVIDVASIKIKPVEQMVKYLPSTCEIIGTHPLFGPQSGKFGIKGLNIVLCPVRTQISGRIFAFCKYFLKMNVLIRTPDQHDKEMAYVQALTHFIGRAVNQMNVPEVEQKTKAFEALLSIRNMLGGDSFELFQTIENGNPYAKEIRMQLMNQFELLENSLK